MLGAENCPWMLKFAEDIVEIRHLEGRTTKPIYLLTGQATSDHGVGSRPLATLCQTTPPSFKKPKFELVKYYQKKQNQSRY